MSQQKDYFDLVKSIGESKSKQEEDRIISEEVVHLKKAVQQQQIPKKKLKEMVIRSLYVEMLGQDASFAYIKAVELCASTSISQKKVGYLAASLCFSPNHEFRFMLVNQIQRDMKSTSMLDICSALVAVCKLVTEDMIPAVITDVVNLLKHDSEFVRKGAISALHRFYQMDKQVLADHTDKVRRALCDKDPSVMAASLPLFQAMIQDDALSYKDLVPSFVSILKQIVDHRLPRDYDYHRIPSPWIQMNLLRVLALLGRGDQASSEGMYEVLIEVMKRADTGINVGYAIVYESIKTVTTIYPNTVLMDAAATAISRFIRSESHNLKYIGIKGLAAIVKDHPRYAADHQLAVIDCLEDPDETLKRKTLDLLFRMTNAINVEFIVNKLLSFLATSVDDHFRSDLVHQITQCAERFAPSNTWYVQTIIKVFELAGDKVKASVAQTLTQLIAEGAEIEEEDEDVAGAKDDELRTEAVEHFLDLLDKPKIPGILAQTMAWVLGEYGYLSPTCTKEDIMDKLCVMATQAKESETKAHIVTAISKLIAQNGSCPSRVLQTIQLYAQSSSVEVQERCLEILALLQNSETMVEVLPVDASCEDIEVDDNLSFLNQYVQMALNHGAKPYDPPASFLAMLQGEGDDHEKKATLNITPYEMPKIPTVAAVGMVSALPSSSASSSSSAHNSHPALPSSNNNNSAPAVSMLTAGTNQNAAALNIATSQGNQLINTRGSNQIWGRKPEPPPPAPAPAAPVVVPGASPANTMNNTYNNSNNNNNNSYNGSTPTTPTPTTAAAPSSSSFTASSPPPPPQPRVLTEKEKMAMALFGGVSGTSSAAVTGGAGARRRSTAAAANNSATNSAVNSPLPATTTTTAVSANANQGVDIFADMNTVSAPSSSSASASAPAHQSNSNSNLNIMDDLLGMDMPAAQPQPPQLQPYHMPAAASPLNNNSTSNSNSTSSSRNDLDLLSLGGVMGGGGTAAAHYHTPTQPVSTHYSAPVHTNTNTTANTITDIFANIDLSPATAAGGGGGGLASQEPAYNVMPYAINTAEFGRRWGSTPVEAKHCITTNPSTFPRQGQVDLETLRKAMPAHYHHVESIPQTQEAIFAATVTNVGAILLVHAKVQQPGKRAVDIIVKSTAMDIPQREISVIAQAFAMFRG